MRANQILGSRRPAAGDRPWRLLAGVAPVLGELGGAPGLLGVLGRLRLAGQLGLPELLGAQAIGTLTSGLGLPARRGVLVAIAP